MKQAKNISSIKAETAQKRFVYMQSETENYLQSVDNEHVYISMGNTKTGNLVPSVSLRPVLDCKNCAKCSGQCYDLRSDCLYKTVMKTRAKNAAIYQADPERYFNEISAACKFFISFRWHIGGDIVSAEYFQGVIRVAEENPQTKFLIFTKSFGIVNSYLDSHNGVLPENLQVIFSGWYGQKMENPYNLPTSHPLFADGRTSAPDGAKYCGGNCTKCLLQNTGCWSLNRGESVIFMAH